MTLFSIYDSIKSTIQLSDHKIREKFERYGYYGYEIDSKILIEPLTGTEMNELKWSYSALVGENELELITVDRCILLRKKYSKQVRAISLSLVGDPTRTLQPLLLVHNIMIVFNDRLRDLKPVYHMNRHRKISTWISI